MAHMSIYSLQKDMSADLVKLLSFVLDSNPVWKDHIEALCSRLSRVLYLLRRLTKELYLQPVKMAALPCVFPCVLKLWH